MKKIGDFEIVEHGIFYSVNCSALSFEHVVTGFGNNLAEAIYNCLDQMAMRDFDMKDMEKRILEQMSWDVFPIEPSISKKDKYREQKRYVEYYHVSIRWNETHKLPTKGLMRCCIATLDATTRRDIVNCNSCNTLMRVKNGVWENLTIEGEENRKGLIV